MRCNNFNFNFFKIDPQICKSRYLYIFDIQKKNFKKNSPIIDFLLKVYFLMYFFTFLFVY